ncbi:phage tail protein [Paenibacillus sp. FSL H8-0457]|uniref:phage tail protein n=1 Tax=unclassified Paenibacillus TaxID=185978 RepID=UPI0003E1C6FB|nr:phage tail protein [Paenibacillus sp. FSL H8-457]ETT58170.1 hypothetical protein C172_27523 [Paenibacillus sp. FSL H8-457]
MSFNEKLPDWGNPGTEPPASKKQAGFLPSEKPPADWFNWLFNRAYKVLEEIRSKVELLGNKGKPGGYAGLDNTGKIPPELLPDGQEIVLPDASLTEKGIVQLSNATNGIRENVAPTEKALGEVMKEALAGKQLGVEQKANLVAVLNSKGITASTNESWAQLISKLSDPNIVNASDATLPELHSGLSVHMIQDYVAYGKDGKRLVGTVPDITGTTEIPLSDIQNPQAQPSFRFPVPYGAYRSSGSSNYMRVNVPALIPGNLPKDVTLFNVKGILERMTTAEKQAIVNSIIAKGVAASVDDTNTVLANKITQINTGRKWAAGQIDVVRTTGSGSVAGLGFTPRNIILSMASWGGAQNGYVMVYSADAPTNGQPLNRLFGLDNGADGTPFVNIGSGFFSVQTSLGRGGIYNYFATE